MRRLIITRGPQGAGKSTFLHRIGLGSAMLSYDMARMLLNSPVLGADGRFGINQAQNNRVFGMIQGLLRERMRNGETFAFDATNPRVSDVSPILQMAAQYRYQVLVVDFFTMDIERVYAQNAQRPEPFCVGKHAIDRVVAAYQPMPRDVQTVVWDDQGGHERAANTFLAVQERDLSSFRRVVHVGDIQGCFSVLAHPDSPLAGGLADDTFYVFIGDLLDRGLENDAVWGWARQTLVGRPNVAIIGGNHELHIERWCAGLDSVSREFSERTLPQLQNAGFKPGGAERLLASLYDAFPYHWRGHRVLCTHAGLPSWPERLAMVSLDQLRNGPGRYDDPVDQAFEAWSEQHAAQTGVSLVQIHGHRNPKLLDIMATPHSINLEGGVEFGGHLRFVTLDEQGFTPVCVRNTVFRTMQEWSMIHKLENKTPPGRPMPIAPWAEQGMGAAVIPAPLLSVFRNHPMVVEKPSAVLPHVVALNFSKEAFFDKQWCDITTMARGLFVDITTGEPVARSYEKFFNIGERPETTVAALTQSLSFPVTGYIKENGFLGITGYDPHSGQLVVGSKSRLDGAFADMFQEILAQTLGTGGMERLLRLLRDQGASATFEVIDPVRDPHMIDHERAHVVLLDVVRRGPVFEKMPYDDLVRVGQILGVAVKERAVVLTSPIAFERFIQRPMTDRAWRWKGRAIEGFVFEDQANFQVKLKTAFYAFWKQMRALKDRVASVSGTNRPLGRQPQDPEAQAFLAFCQAQPVSALEQSIVALRTAFETDPNQVLAGEAPILPARDLTGFLRGLEALATLAQQGLAKPTTLQRFVQGALSDPDKRAAALAHPDWAVVMTAAQSA